MLDGNWVDMLTMITGMLAVLVKPLMRWRMKIGPCWFHREAVNDFLNGASVAPFALLMASPFSQWVLKEMLTASKVSLGLAGGIGVLYVAKELVSLKTSEA